MRSDFWNHPDRWEGIDPHKEMFWMRRRKDVIAAPVSEGGYSGPPAPDWVRHSAARYYRQFNAGYTETDPRA